MPDPRTYTFLHEDDFEITFNQDEEGYYEVTLRIPSSDLEVKQGKFGIDKFLREINAQSGWSVEEEEDLESTLQALSLDINLSGQTVRYAEGKDLEDM